MAKTTNPHAVSKHTLTMLDSLWAALRKSAAKEGRDPSELIVDLIEKRVIADETLDDYTKRRLRLRDQILDGVVEAATAIKEAGNFAESITHDAIALCLADPAWRHAYAEYVEDDIYKAGNPLKGPINREIGYRVRRAMNGDVIKDKATGKPLNVKVLGSIIQSYTPMRLPA